MAEEAKAGASIIVNEVTNINSSSCDTMISLLTPPLSTKMNKRVSNHGDIARSVLTRGEERALVTRDKKTIHAIEDSVKDGVDSS